MNKLKQQLEHFKEHGFVRAKNFKEFSDLIRHLNQSDIKIITLRNNIDEHYDIVDYKRYNVRLQLTKRLF